MLSGRLARSGLEGFGSAAGRAPVVPADVAGGRDARVRPCSGSAGTAHAERSRTVEVQDLDRRTLLKGGGAALAGMTVLKVAGPAHAFPGGRARRRFSRGWISPRTPRPDPPGVGGARHLVHAGRRLLRRQPLQPARAVAADWRLAIGGLVKRPQTLTLADLKARPRREVDFTLECSGNTGLPFFHGGVGNARWAGAQLAPILRQAGVARRGSRSSSGGLTQASRHPRQLGVLDPDGDPMAIPTTTTTGRRSPRHRQVPPRPGLLPQRGRSEGHRAFRAQHDRGGRPQPRRTSSATR